ncbi:MAG: NAD(P)-dependent oxidoreductase [Candidatus Viridilinea halotolerans]|uniref:NAD(P)-dependent oxidoreductase n=1 Tax=Candidatus Viridilinea halotolerans TaxID=2491704 RepID=A0A426TU01_9CHLR|nr:MAG: NAD(P)-dependent oxidoreductase [Candidatus Viridilinea halotolerans]
MYLVTGAGGYIGRHLVRALLAQGHAVRAIDWNAEALAPLQALGATTQVADLSNMFALIGSGMDKVRVVYHLAGSPLGNAKRIWRTNAQTLEAVANACQEARGLRAFIFASSGAVYPSSADWLDEQTKPAPTFAYAAAKVEAEQLLVQLRQWSKLPFQIARIAAVYGPASPALMVEQVRRGRFPLIDGGQHYTSNIHIDDLIKALLAMPKLGKAGRIYNLADDEPTTVASFYGLLAQLLNAPPPPSISPRTAQTMVWLVNTLHRLTLRQPPLPFDLVAMAALSHRMRNTRMHRELQIKLAYPSYRDGLPTCVPQ